MGIGSAMATTSFLLSFVGFALVCAERVEQLTVHSRGLRLENEIVSENLLFEKR
jgi:hypothetical protein